MALLHYSIAQLWLAPTVCLCSDLVSPFEAGLKSPKSNPYLNYQWWVTLLRILKGDRVEFYLIKSANQTFVPHPQALKVPYKVHKLLIPYS